MAKYANEREGQLDFYQKHLPLVDREISLDDILQDYTDGVVRGTIIEFKLDISDLNKTLFQAIKYLSAMRLKGKSIPAQILLVSLNAEKAYLYDSAEYLHAIEETYAGAASKGNGAFLASNPKAVFSYGDSDTDRYEMVQALKRIAWTKVHIDENCIVGWAERYYREKRDARKADFLGDEESKVKIVGEIRRPTVLEEYIHPYVGKTNVKFKYLMDRLNDFLSKKDLGAFYTPEPFAAKAAELVREAIARVPEGNDYIILDRCAGTGNLEMALTEDELSHTIVSTYEYYEYKVLFELLSDKVRHIIPPVESDDTFVGGMVRGSDALSKEFLDNEVVKGFVDEPNCTVILYENVPFAETTSMEHQKLSAGRKSSAGWKNSWVVEQMRSALKVRPQTPSTALNDMGNAFIWSGFEYYLRQPTDSYVLFSPIKYWKSQHLIDKRPLGGFACDRREFHARKHVCVTVVLWANEEWHGAEFSLPGFDMEQGTAKFRAELPFRQISARFSSEYYDKRKLASDRRDDFTVKENGLATAGQKVGIVPMRGDDIIGYLVADSSGFDNPDLHSCLLVAPKYNGHGFYLRRDNFLEKLPLFAAGRYIAYNGSWTERGRVMKSADGAQRYRTDVASGKLGRWLLKCLLFCCMEYQNHMRSQYSPSGSYYRNEICLDTTHGETAASEAMMGLEPGEIEATLLAAWESVLSSAKNCPEYDPRLTYGLYQIGTEIDTHYKDEATGKTVFRHPELHGNIAAVKALAKEYYRDVIVPVLFDYELLK